VNVLFRADGGAEVGLGHLMRCLSLAQELREWGHTVAFLCADHPFITSRLADEGLAAEFGKASAGGEDDAAETTDMARRMAADVIVCDGYAFDERFQRALRDANPEIRMLCIDDTAETHYVSDAVLNQNPGAEALNYSCEPHTRLFLGATFLMLRKEFLAADRNGQVSDVVRRVVVTMGGSDPENLSIVAAKALSKLHIEGLQVRVVIGGANPHSDSVIETVNKLGFGFEALIQPIDIVETFQWADMALSSGGSTCWELAYLGIPNVIITQAANQEMVASFLDAGNSAVWCGRAADLVFEDLVGCLRDVVGSAEKREEIVRSGLELVDGKGVRRAAEALLNIAA